MISAIKNYLRKNLLFVSIRLRSRGEDPANYIVQQGVTDICIDGYPRSANSFSVRMFREANPESVIAHHTHSIANIKKAIECNVPIVVLIRDPEEAVVSSVIAHKNNLVDEEVQRYIDFYNWVFNHIDSVVIAKFEQVINNFNSVIVEVNKHYNKSFMMLNDVKEADDQVKKDIEKRYDQLGQDKMSHIKPVPTKERNHETDKLRDSILQHDDFMRAKKIYLDVTTNTIK